MLHIPSFFFGNSSLPIIDKDKEKQMNLSWELLDNNDEWSEAVVVAGVIPDASMYKKAVLLSHNEIIMSLVSKPWDAPTASPYFWAVGEFNDKK